MRFFILLLALCLVAYAQIGAQMGTQPGLGAQSGVGAQGQMGAGGVGVQPQATVGKRDTSKIQREQRETESRKPRGMDHGHHDNHHNMDHGHHKRDANREDKSIF